MAKENFVLLHGQIVRHPRVHISPQGKSTKATIPVRVMRRPYLTGNGQISGGNLYIDTPIVTTANEDLIKVISELSLGDMVDIRGVLTTREVKKTSVCPSCQKPNSRMGNFVFVTAIYVCGREKGLDLAAGTELLKKRSEISNQVMIIGTLCRDPEIYRHENGIAVTQYQIASNRKFHIRDAHESERTDYPYVKTMRKQAEDDYTHLKTNSSVFINGALQTRQIERTTVCDHCDSEYKWSETVSEIVPYSVEYLMNCHFPEHEGEEEEAK